MVSSLLMFVATAASGAVSVPEDVAAALRENAQALAGIEVSGHYQRKLVGNVTEALQQLGTLEPEEEFTWRIAFRLKLDGGRLLEETKYPPSEFNPPDSVNLRAFDSEKLYAGTVHPTEGPTRGNLSIYTPKALAEDERAARAFGEGLFEIWYLHMAGFEAPQKPSELGQPLRSLLLDKTSRGTVTAYRSEQRAGRQVHVVEVRCPDPWASNRHDPIESDPKISLLLGDSKALQQRIEKERRELAGATRIVRFILDPAMRCAVVEVDEMRGESGEPMFVTRNSDFREAGKGLWLPRVCETSGYAYGTRPAFSSKAPLYLTTVTIDELDRREFSAKDFQVWFDVPGVAVFDHSHENASPGSPYQYRVPSDIEQLKRPGRHVIMTIIGVCLVSTLGALIAWRLVRRRVKAP